jgi:hypothetical protein
MKKIIARCGGIGNAGGLRLMRRSLLHGAVIAFTLLFAACAEPPSPPSVAAVPDEVMPVSTSAVSCAGDTCDPAAEVIALKQGPQAVCGTKCPAGYHPTAYTSGAGCPGSGNNQVMCAPNSGTEFETCGTTCPAGYHPEEYSTWSPCWIGSPGIFRNQTRCVANSGTEFETCGTTCPDGYHPEEYSTWSSCWIGSPGIFHNRTSCAANAGTQFLTCGTCPGGYHVSQYNTWPSCSLGGVGSPNNQRQCDVNAGESFNVCGSTCPSGYVVAGADYSPGCGTGSVADSNRVQCQRLLDGDVSVWPSPVTVPSGQSVNVTVSWSTTHATSAELRVTPPGQAERVLSTNLSSSLSYGPVRAGETHTFRLFGNGELLDTDWVIAAAALTGTISASPQTVVVAGSTGTTTIAWSTQNAGSSARVYVRVNGGAPSLFAAGASGTQAASWIAPGSSYRFSLHAGDSTTAELAVVVVTGQAAVVPTSGPWWNPARSGNALDLRPSGTNLGVTWLTYDPDGTPVWYASWLARTGAGYGGTVNRYTWNGSSATSSVVGTMTLTPATSTTGSLAYTVDGRSATEPIEYFQLAGAPMVPSLSGVWYPPAESGWGVYFDTQGTTHSTYVTVYAADGRPTWAYGVATGGATVVSFNLLRVTGTNLCPGCTGPTSASTATAGTLTVDTTQLGSSQLRVDLSWPVWPRTAVTLSRMF